MYYDFGGSRKMFNQDQIKKLRNLMYNSEKKIAKTIK